MGQCIAMLEQIAVELLDAIKNAKAKDWAKLLPEAFEIAKNAYADYECFKNNKAGIAKGALNFILDSGDTKQCILDHLQAAMSDVSDIPAAVMKGDWDGVTSALESAVNEVQAALNC